MVVKPRSSREEWSLEFVNRLVPSAGRRSPCLKNGKDLVGWLRGTELVPQSALDDLAGRASESELDQVAAQARELGRWFRSFVIARMGKPLAPGAVNELKPLNKILNSDVRHFQIEIDHQARNQLSRRAKRQWTTPEDLLLPIAEAMKDLVCEADFTDVRECEGKGCQSLFRDQTRARARRWCSMSICGNRFKQALRRKPPKDA